MQQSNSEQNGARVCVCVIFNHPYPDNIALIRRLYAGRFSKLLFLVPLIESDEEDVITIYRGSYAAAGYVSDARRELAAIDADHFLFIHDDVLLQPRVNERNFYEYFPLGPDEAFIAEVGHPPADAADWIWYFGLIARLYFPKSILFGAGIEYSMLLKHLPPSAAVRRGLEKAGRPSAETVQLETINMRDVRAKPHRILLTGISSAKASGAPSEAFGGPQEEVERLSLEANTRLIEAMLASLRQDGRHTRPDDHVDLPLPLVASGVFTDFYVVPKSRFKAFAHYAGVAAAANLWAEVMIPTIMLAVCERIRTAGEFEMDFAGFDAQHGLDSFLAPKFMAIHPLKMTQLSADEKDTLVSAMAELAEGRPWTSCIARLGIHPFRAGGLADYTGPGWYGLEDWGRWAEPQAELRFDVHAEPIERVRLHLRAALHPDSPRRRGSVRLNDGPLVPIEASEPEADFVVELGAGSLAPGEHVVRLTCDNPICPSQLIPGADDDRYLGFALREIEFA